MGFCFTGWAAFRLADHGSLVNNARMQHSEAVSALHEILPAIKSAGSPEAALLQYADRRRLAGPQLEKLAQVYNTARTLSFLEKHPDDRAADHPIVDPSALLSQYEAGTSKAASAPLTFRPVERVAAPNFLKAATGGMQKAADVKVVHEDPEWLAVEAREFEKKKRDELDEAKIESGELGIAAAADEREAKKAYETLRDRMFDLPFREVEEDALALGCAEPHHRAVMDRLAVDMDGYVGRPKIARCTAVPTDRRLAWDRHGVVGLIKVAAEKQAEAAELRAYAAHIKVASGAAAAQGQDTGQGTGQGNGPGGGGGPRRNPNSPQAPTGGTNAPRPNYDALFKDVIKWPESKDEKSEKSEYKSVQTAADAIKDMLKEYPGARSQISAVAGDKDGPGILSGVLDSESPHKRQRLIDDKVRDTNHVGTLQRIMMTDPILREADPDELVAAYNDLVAVKPDIASTPQQLAFALRESLQYGGVPASSAKTYAEIAKAQTDAEKNRMAIDDARYRDRPISR